jgi:hypothetical protein
MASKRWSREVRLLGRLMREALPSQKERGEFMAKLKNAYAADPGISAEQLGLP